jgi:hypothetical protein
VSVKNSGKRGRYEGYETESVDEEEEEEEEEGRRRVKVEWREAGTR